MLQTFWLDMFSVSSSSFIFNYTRINRNTETLLSTKQTLGLWFCHKTRNWKCHKMLTSNKQNTTRIHETYKAYCKTNTINKMHLDACEQCKSMSNTSLGRSCSAASNPNNIRNKGFPAIGCLYCLSKELKFPMQWVGWIANNVVCFLSPPPQFPINATELPLWRPYYFFCSRLYCSLQIQCASSRCLLPKKRFTRDLRRSERFAGWKHS